MYALKQDNKNAAHDYKNINIEYTDLSITKTLHAAFIQLNWHSA